MPCRKPNPSGLPTCAALVTLLLTLYLPQAGRDRGAARADELPPPQKPVDAVLKPGEAVTLRIRQVLPTDGFSPGERLLNSRNTVLPGDHFLAEIVRPPGNPPALVGGTVTKLVRPGWFGRPGYLTLQLSQLVETADAPARPLPWHFDMTDHRITAQMRRAWLTALLGLEGVGLGAVIGAQMNVPNKLAPVAGGAGVGLLLGMGYASFQRGQEASLEPGDTFRVVPGTMYYQPVPKNLETILYPPADPNKRKRGKQ